MSGDSGHVGQPVADGAVGVYEDDVGAPGRGSDFVLLFRWCEFSHTIRDAMENWRKQGLRYTTNKSYVLFSQSTLQLSQNKIYTLATVYIQQNTLPQ